MSKIYIRKINANEIGIRKGGKSKRAGSFLMVSKKCLDFFPYLDPKLIDDKCQITAITPNSKGTLLIEYVYHNKGIHENVRGTRNEYRLYIPREIDEDSYLEPEDLILMKHIKEYDGFFCLKLFLIKNAKSNEYKKILNLLGKETHKIVEKVDISSIDDYSLKKEVHKNKKIFVDTHQKEIDMEKTTQDIGDIIQPSASALIENLRSLGYSPAEAVADIIDNSISAKAQNINITIKWNGAHSFIAISDDGIGMNEDELIQAMKPGSKNPKTKRKEEDLGRFGMGLKSASFSIGKQLTVVTKKKNLSTFIRRWDLDYVSNSNEWKIFKTINDNNTEFSKINTQSGTNVIIEDLDRMLSLNGLGSIITSDEFFKLTSQIEAHLALVFHRFIEKQKIKIFLNDEIVKPFNPHFGFEDKEYLFKESLKDSSGSETIVKSFIVPSLEDLPVPTQRYIKQNYGFTQMQGAYVYRGDRLISYGGWLGLGKRNLMKINDDYALGRMLVELNNDIDSSWRLDIKKTMAIPPLNFLAQLQRAADIARKESMQNINRRNGIKKESEIDGLWSKKNNEIKIDKSNSIYRQLASDDDVGQKFINYIKNLEKSLPK